MAFPIGLVFLLRQIPHFLSPLFLTYMFLVTFQHLLHVQISTTQWIVTMVVTHPVVILVQGVALRRRINRQAAERGATLPAFVEQTSFSIVKEIRMAFRSGYPLEIFLDWSKKYGKTYGMSIFSEKRLITLDPSHVKAILTTQSEEFEKGPILFSQWKSLLGAGIFNSDGDIWKFHRVLARPFFGKERVRDFDIFDSHAMEVIAKIKEKLIEGQAIDFLDAAARFTLDSATEFLFAKSVGSIEAGLPYSTISGIPNPDSFRAHPSNVFVEAFTTGVELIARRTRTGTTWPLSEFWGDQVTPLRKVTDAFIKPVYEEALERVTSGKSAEKEEIFLDHLLAHTQDRQVVLDQIINILAASRDTTAAFMTFSVYMLSQHPDIANRLREEILAQVGPSGKPTYDDVKSMKYLRAFLNETLRLYPPVPWNSRTSNRPTTLPNPDGAPFFVPAGTKVLFIMFWIHRREDLWGPDAHEFDPDRFLDERLHRYLVKNPSIFLPFGAGPRICLGQEFAYNETSFFIIRLLQNFKSFSLAPEAQPKDTIPPTQWQKSSLKSKEKVMLDMSLNMFTKGGLWVKMESA